MNTRGVRHHLGLCSKTQVRLNVVKENASLFSASLSCQTEGLCQREPFDVINGLHLLQRTIRNVRKTTFKRSLTLRYRPALDVSEHLVDQPVYVANGDDETAHRGISAGVVLQQQPDREIIH